MLRRAAHTAAILSALVAAVLPATALGAQPYLRLDGKPVKVGARVHAWTPRYVGTCCNAMVIYMVPAAKAPATTKPAAGKPTATGALRVSRINWHHGIGLGTVDFVVPKTVPGRYRLLVYCRKCAP